jgi:hypothetical protein
LWGAPKSDLRFKETFHHRLRPPPTHPLLELWPVRRCEQLYHAPTCLME